jgi:hypothetical protein
VDGEGLVVEVRRQEVVVRDGELNAHQQREHAAEQEEEERPCRVPDSDLRVVHRRPVAKALRRVPNAEQTLLLGLTDLQRGRLGERLGVCAGSRLLAFVHRKLSK